MAMDAINMLGHAKYDMQVGGDYGPVCLVGAIEFAAGDVSAESGIVRNAVEKHLGRSADSFNDLTRTTKSQVLQALHDAAYGIQ